jgi:hypothetical protein
MTAKRMHQDIEWTMLEKSQEVDERDVADVMDFWMEVVKRAQQKLS